jgi:hypothetical protein
MLFTQGDAEACAFTMTSGFFLAEWLLFEPVSFALLRRSLPKRALPRSAKSMRVTSSLGN